VYGTDKFSNDDGWVYRDSFDTTAQSPLHINIFALFLYLHLYIYIWHKLISLFHRFLYFNHFAQVVGTRCTVIVRSVYTSNTVIGIHFLLFIIISRYFLIDVLLYNIFEQTAMYIIHNISYIHVSNITMYINKNYKQTLVTRTVTTELAPRQL